MGLLSFVKDAGEKLWDNLTQKREEQSAKLKEHIEKVGLKGHDDLKIEVKDDVVTVTGEGLTQEEKEKIMLAVGNVAGIAKVKDNISTASDAPAANFYTVAKGDTLSRISQKEYGNPNLYMKIFDANKPMLKHPDKIYPGQVLRIPPKE